VLQCIDRRFAVLAANQEANDPGEAYRVDLLIGERKKTKENEIDPRTMLAAYLETTNDIERMDARKFFGRFGEASRILRHIGGNADVTGMQIFDLHRRHAKQVNGVLEEGIAKYNTEIRKRVLPPTCVLRLTYESGPSNGRDQVASSTALTSVPLVKTGGNNVFKKNGDVWAVRYARGKEFMLLPSKGAAYIHLLLSQPSMQLSAIDMACKIAKNRDRYTLGNAGPRTDLESLAAYRVKLTDLREDLQKAKDNNDPGEQEKIQEEIESISKELRKSRGLGGRLRTVSDDRERVRKAVSNAVKRAIKDIAQYDRCLADHLASPRLICGRKLSYFPGQDLKWEV
jgi:hypothetical protein